MIDVCKCDPPCKKDRRKIDLNEPPAFPEAPENCANAKTFRNRVMKRFEENTKRLSFDYSQRTFTLVGGTGQEKGEWWKGGMMAM